MGPLHSPLQKSLVNEFLEEARASGAEVLEFGMLPEGDLVAGNFVRPSLVLNPDPELRIVTAEQMRRIEQDAFERVQPAVPPRFPPGGEIAFEKAKSLQHA